MFKSKIILFYIILIEKKLVYFKDKDQYQRKYLYIFLTKII